VARVTCKRCVLCWIVGAGTVSSEQNQQQAKGEILSFDRIGIRLQTVASAGKEREDQE